MEDHLRSLEQMYSAAPCHHDLQEIGLNLEQGRSVIHCVYDNRQHHAAGAVHGSFLFKLLDDAAFFAAQSLQSEHFVLTQSFHLHFTRPFVSGRLYGRGEITKAGSQLSFASSVVEDENGKTIAMGSGTFATSSIALGEIEGYRP